MGSFVAKISRKGYDVNTCSDRELLFSSEWPLLKIHSQGTVDLTADGQTIVTHNLGYNPMILLWTNYDWFTGTVTSTVTPMLQYNTIDTTKVVFQSSGSVPWPVTIKVRYMVFRQDIDTDFEAPNFITSDTVAGASGNPVFKIAVEGKDVSSTDYRDFVVHSNTRSPLIHQIKKTVTDGVNSQFSFNHTLGYKPTYLVYAGFGGTYQLAGQFPDLEVSVTSTTVNIFFPSSYGANYNIVVVLFKDPILLQ